MAATPQQIDTGLRLRIEQAVWHRDAPSLIQIDAEHPEIPWYQVVKNLNSSDEEWLFEVLS